MLQDKTADLKKRIINYINQNTPISVNGKQVFLEDLSVQDPPELDSIQKQLNMKYLSKDELSEGKGSLVGHLSGKIVIKDKSGKTLSASPKVASLFAIPYVTNRNTYMVNGGEKIILKQMRLKPGVYTSKAEESNDIKTKIMFDNTLHGGKYVPQISLRYSPDSSEFKVEIKKGDKNHEFNGINFLRELGFKDQQIMKMMGNGAYAEDVWRKTAKRNNKSIRDIYQVITGSSPKADESDDVLREKLFQFTMQNAKFGSGTNVVKDNLGVDSDHLSRDVVQEATAKTFGVAIGSHKEDDADDLRYKDVFTDNDFIMEQVEKDFEAFKDHVLKSLDKSDKVTYGAIMPHIRSLGNNLNSFMSSGSLVESPEQINPLYVSAQDKKITQLGKGGLSKNTVESSSRNLASNSINRIDPIETPESGNIGIVEHLTHSAKVKNNTIYADVLKVSDGVAIDDAAHTVELSPDEDHDSKIAFYDSRYVKKEGNKITFLMDEVPARYMGNTVTLPVRQIQYIDKSPQNIMGYAANMIPFVAHNDGNRALMGANMQKQAILLKNRENPFVTTAVDQDKKETYDKVIGDKFGKPVKSDVDGVVHKIEDGIIHVKDADGKVHKHEFYHYFPFNQGFIHNDVVVKPGDAVKKGDLLAEGWQTKDGKLALGINTKIGYLAYKGYNYEDGVVVSESYSKKMATEELQKLEVDIPEHYLGGRGSNVMDEVKKHTTRQDVFEMLDRDGIVKVGQELGPGKPVVSMLRDVQANSDDPLDAIKAKKKSATRYTHSPFVIPRTSYLEGKVVRVNVINNPEAGIKQRIIVTMTNSKPLTLGDKISGRHGNKGTITKILPDEEMPVAEDGKALELMFSPLAIPSRKNPGQLLEAHAGLVAEKTGKPFIINNFDHTEKDRVEKGLKEISIPDGKMRVTLKEKQPDGTIKDVPVDNPVTVGNMYIMKLKHKVDDKIQERSNAETYISNKTYTPAKVVGEKQGEKHNPQSLGEMEMRALQAHGAVWNILENSTFKSDGGGDAQTRKALFNALATGKVDDLDMPATPETLKVLSDHLRTLGMKVTPLHGDKEAKSLDDPFDSLKLTPMKPTEMLKVIGRENRVIDHQIFDTKPDSDKDVALPGGLYDEKIFGQPGDPESRKKWGYIKLHTPMPNPMFILDGKRTGYNPYEALTKVKSADLLSLMEGKKVLVIDPDKFTGFDNEDPEVKSIYISQYKDNLKKAGLVPGQLVDPRELENRMSVSGRVFWKAGGEAIQHMLDNVNLDKRIEEAKQELDSAKGADINKRYKHYKQLLSLKNNKINPSDLMLHYVPVLPTHLRPIIKEGSGIIKTGLNDLYSKIVYTSNKMERKYDDGMNLMLNANPTDAARDVSNLFRKMTDLTGHTEAKDKATNKVLHGIKTNLSTKDGLIRDEMLSKRVDFSGRSVIGVDPALNMNEVGLPIDMAKYVYKPFVLKDLYERGKAKSIDDAKKKWEKLDVETVESIKRIANDRPVLLNRQPSLHKFSIQAFKPIILEKTKNDKTIRNIQLNPLVVTGFNADFDGDTMALHVPITEKAKEEAKKIMMPSQNLINPTNGSMVVEIRHEMALGIYYLTVGANNPQGTERRYNSYAELKKDFLSGNLGVKDKVSIGNVSGVTAGSALFNLLLPDLVDESGKQRYRDFKKTWGSKDVSRMLSLMYNDAEEGKAISKMQISQTLDKIKDLGFSAATKSGISLGIKDFKKVDFSNIVDKHVGNLMKDAKTEKEKREALILGYKAAEDEIQKKLKEDHELLPQENSLKIMMESGARAKPDQIRRMMVTVGVGMDLNKQLTDPVIHSHLEGLSPQEYWLHAHDSRKGMADRSVSTQAPGALTREVWSATQDMLIKEADCGTADYIELSKGDNSIAGRFAAKNFDIVGANGTVYTAKNTMITSEAKAKIYGDDSIKKVKVRSPLRCRTVGGVCQKCYGAMPGTNQVPDLGTAIGVMASQALGEPVMQMTMNTFHSGGTSSSATLGLPRIKQLLDLSKQQSNAAVLAKVSGTVESIIQDESKPYDVVIVGKTQHIIPHTNNNKSRPLRVKQGDVITKGDFLTVGNLADIEIANGDEENKIMMTNAHPETLYKLMADHHGEEHAFNYVKDYITSNMEYTFNKTIGQGSIDRRHLETIVSKMGSKATILDPGDSPFLRGQDVDRNEVDKWNAENSTPYSAKQVSLNVPANVIGKVIAETVKDKAGNIIIGSGEEVTPDAVSKMLLAGKKDIKVMPKPAKYQSQLESKNTVVDRGHQNWLSNTAVEDVFAHVNHGAATGQTDKLQDPRTRVMTGKLVNVGEGFKLNENPKTRSVTNNIANKMLNFFTNPSK